MSANNETGVIQPMLEIGDSAGSAGCCFTATWCNRFGKQTTDLSPVDAASSLRTNSTDRKVPAFSICASGCRSSGLVWRCPREPAAAGTENVPGDCRHGGSGRMGSLRESPRSRAAKRRLRDRLMERNLPRFSGRAPKRRCGASAGEYLERQLSGVSSETILMALDLEGVCASSGSPAWLDPWSRRMSS